MTQLIVFVLFVGVALLALAYFHPVVFALWVVWGILRAVTARDTTRGAGNS
jgi:hypothetical protein